MVASTGVCESTESHSAVFLRTDQRIGKYRVIAELGRGGAASVHLAVAHGGGDVWKLVVLKALLPDLAEQPSAVSAFLDEARLAARLNHSNVVQTYEVGTQGDRSVIVMEYLEGPSLSRVTRGCQDTGQPSCLAMRLHILLQVLEGLHYAHEIKGYDGRPLHIVHRDISPQNVIVTYDGQVKIVDFGIAKAATTSTHTAVGVIKGKVSYMAPEHMSGGEVDRRADIYSLGCMLWAAITGEKLWQGFADVRIVQEVMSGRIPSPRTRVPDCPPALEKIVMKALAFDPEERYSTALQLHNDLDRYVENAGLHFKQRDVGRFVSELFAREREEFNANLERELSLVLSTDPVVHGGPVIPGRDTLTDGTPSSERVKTADLTPPAKPAPSSRRPALLGALAVLLGIVAVVAARSGSLQGGGAVAAPSPSSATSSGAEALPALGSSAPLVRDTQPVAIRFDIKPANAKLVVDGRTLDQGVTEISMPTDGLTHELRTEAKGYDPVVRSFEVRGPTILTVQLSRADARKRPTPAAARSRAASSAPVPGAEATGPGPEACENPFYVDAQGIKHVRPGCH